MDKTNFGGFHISSPVFSNGGAIPARYTCEGEGVNPPLNTSNIPEGTQTLALIVEDPDAPGGTYDHWIVWDIEPGMAIKENSNPGISGTNSSGKTGYHPPCPPAGSHRYYFHMYALNIKPDIPAGETKEKLLQVIQPYIIAEAVIMSTYEKQTLDSEV
ncbi:MAG: YbhB/YbcL family Raf kinase inhibitor-like protein [Chitinophagaceae bacterium]|nr:YbhB/YbcL family Raf kinase inhibitor-like protein [Chitinophagaceae bacterium]